MSLIELSGTSHAPNPRVTPARLSTFLAEITEAPVHAGARISLGELSDALGHRAFGALLFVFAAPVAIPIPIPGVSAILGAPIVLLTWQLMLGRSQPWLPDLMRNRSFDRKGFVAFLLRIIPWITHIERFVCPRLSWIATGRAERVIGLLALVFALVLFLPIPFGNTVPGLSIAVLAIALLERDGVAVIAGTLIGFLGLGIVSGFILGLVVGLLGLVESFI